MVFVTGEQIISEEQRRRMQENRAAALARRQARGGFSSANPEQLSVAEQSNSGHPPVVSHDDYRKIAPLYTGTGVPVHSISHKAFMSEAQGHLTLCKGHLATPSSWNLASCASQKKATNNIPMQREVVSLELISLQEFSINTQSPKARENVLQAVSPLQCLHCETEKNQLISPVYNLKNYDSVVKVLSSLPGIQLQQIPRSTLSVVRSILQVKCTDQPWAPFRPCHVQDTEAEKLLQQLPHKLREGLLPFQLDGVSYGLRRGGRCLIADEMGVGKTIQAIAMAACYIHEGPLIIVCPASLRLMWAEELERWLPFLTPTDVHLVFGQRNNLLEHVETPKIVVVSFTMLRRLKRDLQCRKWAMLIVDESHNLRCTKRRLECDETMAVLDVARSVKRVVLLSGTPSLSRPFDIFHQVDCLWPGLLGRSKYDFASNYCCVQPFHGWQGSAYKDFSKGTRLEELNLLLKETIMVRRLKQDVLTQLPAKRRQVIRLKLSLGDIKDAREFSANNRGSKCRCGFGFKGSCECEGDEDERSNDDLNDIEEDMLPINLSYQEVGVAKLRGFQEWLLNHPIFSDSDDNAFVDSNVGREKMLIFAHHHKVLDTIQEIVHNKCLEYVRIDGTTMVNDRQSAVELFRYRPAVKVAIIGLTAGGVGLNFCAAKSVVFVELPKTASELLQAEDRVHRQGQQSAVNVYIFCAKDTRDETQWQTLSKSLGCVSTMTNGTHAALSGIEVDAVCSSSQLSERTTVPLAVDQGKASKESLNLFEGSHQENFPENLQTGQADVQLRTGENIESLVSLEGFLPHMGGVSFEGMVNGTHGDQGSCSDELHGDLKFNNAPMSCLLSSGAAVAEVEGRIFNASVMSKTNIHDSEDLGREFFPHSLMFEVSQNTGRIHLYARSNLDGLRPVPLQESFRPEDLECFHNNENIGKGSLPKCLVNCIANCDAAVTFMTEWSALRPIQRNQLFGRPLQSPLSLELSCIRAEFPYAPGGLVKGGSKNRVTPRTEISWPVPDGASWRTVSLLKHYGKINGQTLQAWSSDGEPLCKLCQNPCLGSKSKAPEYFEDLFCKKGCFEQYRIKTSQKYLRQELFSLERGVCTICKLDCHALAECIRHLSLEQRKCYIIRKAPEFKKYKRLLERLATDPKEGNAWHADHIVAVSQGGGECNLENMRTLCVICHAKVTAEQRRRRRSSLVRAKNGLQITIEKLIAKVCHKRLKSQSYQGSLENCQESSGSDTDKDLLEIKVMGSVYSSDCSLSQTDGDRGLMTKEDQDNKIRDEK